MDGRLEHSNKVDEKIENILSGLPEYVSEWENNLRAGGKTADTRLSFVRIISRLIDFVGDSSIKSLTYLKVQKFFISIKISNGKVTSDSYQQQIWCCLNNFFGYLKKRKYVDENPMESIDKPKNRDLDKINERRILLGEKEFSDILSAVQKKNYKFQNRDLAMLLVFMSTGMRKTALIDINLDDIDFKVGTLKVIDKGNKFQLYYLNDDIKRVLRNWIKDREEMHLNSTDALFVSYLGKRMSETSIDNIVAKYSEEALGKKISPHKLRAGYVSIYYNKTKDIEATRRAVGHSNVSTTQRYIVTSNKERKDAADYILENLNF